MAASTRRKSSKRAAPEAGRRVVNMRVPDAALERIDRAATMSATTRTEFMVRAAEAAAEQLLLDQVAFRLDEKAYSAFLAALEKPATPPAGLVRLLRTPAPWETRRAK